MTVLSTSHRSHRSRPSRRRPSRSRRPSRDSIRRPSDSIPTFISTSVVLLYFVVLFYSVHILLGEIRICNYLSKLFIHPINHTFIWQFNNYSDSLFIWIGIDLIAMKVQL
jgi:hypothetical protein